MRRYSLSRALARQWMLFTAALSVLFVAATLLLLFVLEDSFIDRRLHSVATTVTDPSTPPASLPESFQVRVWTQLPDDVRTRMQHMPIGGIAEFRRVDGRYVHVLATRSATGQSFALIYDVTGELTVNPGLSRGLAYALALLAALLLCAYALARLFIARTTRRAEALIQQVLASPDPDNLDALAGQEPVREFGDLLRVHAGMWREQLTAVERERETLAFLGHELRTPLQSACTSLALLEQNPRHVAAMVRLQRAIQRLTRASTAILWLSSDAADPTTGGTPAIACISELVDELRPLAVAREQDIALTVAPALHWEAPREVIETLLANLLLNAIQHGGAGTIALHADTCELVLRNSAAGVETAGFGLGLNVARRLAACIGWQMAFASDALGACVTLSWPAACRQAGPPTGPELLATDRAQDG